MKKNVFGRKLKRDKNERRALFKSLMSSLVLNERIKTSEAKAKAIKPEIEKFVTKAKKGTNSAKRILERNLSKPAFDKMLKDIALRFAQRQGGYTRITKIGRRLGDDSQTVLIEWVELNKISNIKDQKLEKVEEKPKNIKTSKKTEASKKKSAKKSTRKSK